MTLGHDAAEKFGVKVNVVGVADPDPSIKDKIDAIERKRADQAKCVRYSSCSFYVFMVLLGAGEAHVRASGLRVERLNRHCSE